MRNLLRLFLIVLVIASTLLAYLFSPWHKEPWPFGNAMSFAFLSSAILALWGTVSIHLPTHRKALIWAFVSGILIGGIGLVAGCVGYALFSKYELSPILGIFVTGPICYTCGLALGVCISFLRTYWKKVHSVDGIVSALDN